jgi:hypothetical protein
VATIRALPHAVKNRSHKDSHARRMSRSPPVWLMNALLKGEQCMHAS